MNTELTLAFTTGFGLGQRAIKESAPKLLKGGRGTTFEKLKVISKLQEVPIQNYTEQFPSITELIQTPLQIELWEKAFEFKMAVRQILEAYEEMAGYVHTMVSHGLPKIVIQKAEAEYVAVREVPEIFSEQSAQESMGLALEHGHEKQKSGGHEHCSACWFRYGFINGQRIYLTKGGKTAVNQEIKKNNLKSLLKSLSGVRAPSTLRADLLSLWNLELMGFQKNRLISAKNGFESAIENLVEVYVKMNHE